MKVYRGSDRDNEPYVLECEEFGYPNRTLCGEPMYENTHFRTEKEAWQSIRASSEAGINLSGSDVHYAKKQLRKAEKVASDAAERAAIVHKKYSVWLINNQSTL